MTKTSHQTKQTQLSSSVCVQRWKKGNHTYTDLETNGNDWDKAAFFVLLQFFMLKFHWCSEWQVNVYLFCVCACVCEIWAKDDHTSLNWRELLYVESIKCAPDSFRGCNLTNFCWEAVIILHPYVWDLIHNLSPYEICLRCCVALRNCSFTISPKSSSVPLSLKQPELIICFFLPVCFHGNVTRLPLNSMPTGMCRNLCETSTANVIYIAGERGYVRMWRHRWFPPMELLLCSGCL